MHQIEILSGHLDETDHLDQVIYEALYRCFVLTDRAFLRQQLSRLKVSGVRNGPGGAAVVACLVGQTIWCANTGDARCVLSRKGRALQLSVDHKPVSPLIESCDRFVGPSG